MKKITIITVCISSFFIVIFCFRGVITKTVLDYIFRPFIPEQAIQIGEKLSQLDIYFFNPARHSNGVILINDIKIENEKELRDVVFHGTDYIKKNELQEISKEMQKAGILYFKGNDTLYFFGTSGFIDDGFGYFYSKFEMDSIKIKKISKKYQIYDITIETLFKQPNWYSFKQ